MKKIKYLIALLTMVVLFCVAGNTKVSATYQEEVEQIEQSESELSKFFDEELVGYIVEFVVALGATVIGVSSFIKSFKNVTGAFSKSADKNEETRKEIYNTKETIISNNESTQKAIEENNKETKKAIEENNMAVQLAIQEDNARTREKIKMIEEVLMLAFSNDDKSLESESMRLYATVTIAIFIIIHFLKIFQYFQILWNALLTMIRVYSTI